MKQHGTKKQHYIPKFYLRQFAEGEHIYVYDKFTRKLYIRKIDEVCCENHLYETEWNSPTHPDEKFLFYNKIEKDLSRKESEYSKVIKKINEICLSGKNDNALICRKNEKEQLRSFVANITCRHPKYIKAVDEDVINSDFSKDEEIKPYVEIINTFDMGNPKDFLRMGAKIGVLSEDLKESPSYKVKQQLESMEFCVCVTDNKEFIITDYPLFVTHKDEESDELDSLFIPLHPKVGILFFDPILHKKYHKFRNRIFNLTNESVGKINEGMALGEQSERVMCRDKNTLKLYQEMIDSNEFYNNRRKNNGKQN